jgi:hypothetical protein
MGIRTGQAQQELSLRQKAYDAEQEWNNRKFPLMEQQLRNQTTALRLESDLTRQSFDLQNANMQATALTAPHMAELDLLAKTGDDTALSQWEPPELKLEGIDNPVLSNYATSIATQKLRAYKKTLLDSNAVYKSNNELADKMFSVATLPGIQTLDKLKLQRLGNKIRNTGISSLTEDEQNFVNQGETLAWQFDPRRKELEKSNLEMFVKAQDSETKELKTLSDTMGDFMVSDEVRATAAARFSEIISKRSAKAKSKPSMEETPKEETKPTTNTTSKQSDTTLQVKPNNDFKLDLKFAAEAIRNGNNYEDVVEKLIPKGLKFKNLKDTPQNRMIIKMGILRTLNSAKLGLPIRQEQLGYTPSQIEE